MSPKKRRGVRRKKKEDIEDNQDSVEGEDNPSNPSSLKTSVENEENDIESFGQRSSRRKQISSSDELHTESSPSLSSPILDRNRMSLKLLNDSVKAEESMEVDEKIECTINNESENDKIDNFEEKESLIKAESMEVDDKTPVVDSSNTSLIEESIDSSEIEETMAKVASPVDTASRAEMQEASFSDISEMNLEDSNLGIKLVKESSTLKNVEGSLIIDSVPGNEEVKNSVINNSVEAKKLNAETVCKESQNNKPILSNDNQKDSSNIAMVVSFEKVKVVKEDTSTKLSGVSHAENTLVSEIRNIGTVNETSNESTSSIKSCEKSNISVVNTAAVSSDETSAEVCDKIELSALCSLRVAKNSTLPLNEESMKDKNAGKNKFSDSSNILLTNVTEDEVSEEDTSKNSTAKCLRRKSFSETDSVKVLDLQIATPEKGNVKKMNTIDKIEFEKGSKKSSNLENDITEKMETSLKPVTSSKTVSTQKVISKSDLVDDEAVKSDSPSKSSEISQNEVTNIDIKISENREEENENCEIIKDANVKINPSTKLIEEITLKSQIEDEDEKLAIPFTTFKSEVEMNAKPAVTSKTVDKNVNPFSSSNALDKNAEPAATFETKLDKNAKSPVTPKTVGNGKAFSVSKTKSMEIDDDIQIVGSSSASLIEESRESSEKKIIKKLKICRVNLIPLEETLKKLDGKKSVAATKNGAKNEETAENSKAEVKKNVKPNETSKTFETEKMEIDDKTRIVDSGSAKLVKGNIESSEKKNAKIIRECRVKLVPLGDIIKKDNEKSLAATKNIDITKPANSKTVINKKPSAVSKPMTEKAKNEKSEAAFETEASKKENSTVASKTKVTANGTPATGSSTKSDKNKKPDSASKTDKSEKSQQPSKAETDKKETPAPTSKRETGSDSQKNRIPGRGFIIGTRGVAEDGKKTLFDCVLCFTGKEKKYGVPGATLNKHIRSKEHALKAMEVENPSLYKKFKDYPSAKSEEIISAILEYEETQKRETLVLASEQNYAAQRQLLERKIATLKKGFEKSGNILRVNQKKSLVNSEPGKSVPAEVPVALNTLSFLSSLKKKDDANAKQPESKAPTALNTLSFLSSVKKNEYKNEKQPETKGKYEKQLETKSKNEQPEIKGKNEKQLETKSKNEKQPEKKVPVALSTLSFLSSLNKTESKNDKQPETKSKNDKQPETKSKNDKQPETKSKNDKQPETKSKNEKHPEIKVPVALSTLSFLSSVKNNKSKNEKQPEEKVPVALNTISFLSSVNKKANDVKQSEEDLRKPVGKYNPETLSQQLGEKQKGRRPDKIVLVMDDRDVFLCAEKLGKFVRVIRKRDLDFAKAVELVKSDFWFGKGTLFMFLGGVFSFLKIRKHSACIENKCEIPVRVYNIEKDTPPNIIIDEALQLHKTILDNTTSDQALFCDLVPVNVESHNILKIEKRLCNKKHPIDLHEKIPSQFMTQYITAINEFNKFVGKHTLKSGFKFASLVDSTFGRIISHAKRAYSNLSSDGVTFNEADYKRRCSSVLSKVETIREQLHSVVPKVAYRMVKENEKSNRQFDKVAIIANSYYKETLTQFSSDKVVVYADEDLKFEGIDEFILEKKKSLPEKTLWLTLIGSFCISEIKNHDVCQSNRSCKELLVTLVPSPEVQNLSSLPETIKKIKESTQVLLKKVRTLIGPKSVFFIIPPYPPTIVSETAFSHNELHTFKCPDTQIYVASDEVINVLNSAFTRLNKAVISLVIKEFQNHKVKCSSIDSYNRSLPAFGHLQIVRQKSDSRSELFNKWQDCVKGMISEFVDYSVKEITVPFRNIVKFDHFVFIGQLNLLNQLSDCCGAKFSIFNVNYPINFEFLQMKLSSLKSISNKPILFVIACDFSLIAKAVFDAKCKNFGCSSIMSYFASDMKDVKTLITDKLLDIRKIVLKIKDTYPVNATVIIAPLFPRHCIERPPEITDSVHRTLHTILEKDFSPCVVEGPSKHWEDEISLLQYYLKDEVLSNLYIRNDHETLIDVIESFLSVEEPYIQWIKPVVTSVTDNFKYSIKILFDKLREAAYNDLNDTTKTKSSITETIKNKTLDSAMNKKSSITETTKNKTLDSPMNKKSSNATARTANQSSYATASLNTSTNYQTTLNTSTNYQVTHNTSTDYQANQNTSTNYQVPSTPYTYNAMSGPHNTYGNELNQGYYPSNSYSYYYPNQPVPPPQQTPLAQAPPPVAQIPPVYPYQYPPQQGVAQQQYSATADSSYSYPNNFVNNSSSASYTQPSTSNMFSSSISQITSASSVQPTTDFRSAGKNIVIENPKELVDFLSEFGSSTWRCQPYEHAFVIGKKDMIEPLASQDMKNVQFIYQNLASIDEGQVSFLVNKMGNIPHRSICFLAFDMSIILKSVSLTSGCKKFKCKQPVSGSCLKTQSHLSQQMNIIIRIKDVVNLATKIASYIRVVVLPVFPSKIFIDDANSLPYHKISHAINDSSACILTGEKIEWKDNITTFLQTWNNFMKVYHDKYTFPKTLPKYPYLKDTITIGDKVKDFFDEDNEPLIWKYAVKKIIKILMSYTEGSNIENTITITKTEESTVNSNLSSSKDTSSKFVVKAWNFSDSIPEKFFDFLFKAIDPKADLEKILENDESYYLVKLTKVSAILITRKLNNILIGDSTLRVCLIQNQDNYPELSFAQEKYISSMFQDAYSRFKSQILRNIKIKLMNVIDFTNYKTQKCKGYCHGDKPNCNFFHTSNDRRRNPLLYTYMQKMCSSPGKCPQDDSCSFAHNIYEQMFYPTNFQTILCPIHDNNSPVTNGFCKFAHKNSPELFFTGSWEDIVTFGLQNSLRFLIGAIRAIHKLTLRTDVKICFISQSEEFLETAFKIADDIALSQYTLKCVNLEKFRYNTNDCDVYFGKLSTVNNYSGKILSTDDYGVLIIDSINNIMENSQDAEHLLKICQRLKISAGLRSPINKVFVSSCYDQGVTGVVSRFLGIPLQEVKASDLHPEPKLTTKNYEENKNPKDRFISKSRSRSRSLLSSSRRRSTSKSYSHRSDSRSRRRRSRSRSLKRRSRSRSRRRSSSLSRSRNRRRSKSREVVRSRRSASRSRRSRSKAKAHKISSLKRKHSPSPQSFKAKKRQASPKSPPQTSRITKLENSSRKHYQQVPHKSFPSSSEKSLESEKNILSAKTLGEEMYRKYLAKKSSMHDQIEEEFKAYKTFPELHPHYEMYYEKFLSDYCKQYGMNTEEDHKEGFWIMHWAQKVKRLKETELDRKTKELEKEFLSIAQPKNVEKAKGGASPDKFSIENTLSLLEELSSKLGMLGPAIVAIINSARESGATTSKGLSVIADKDSLALINMVIEKMNSLQKTCPSSQLPKLIKGVEWTKKLIECAKNPPKEQGLDLTAIAKASLGKDSAFTLNLIKTALAYEGVTSMSKEEINQLFLKVCSIHFEMSMQEK